MSVPRLSHPRPWGIKGWQRCEMWSSKVASLWVSVASLLMVVVVVVVQPGSGSAPVSTRRDAASAANPGQQNRLASRRRLWALLLLLVVFNSAHYRNPVCGQKKGGVGNRILSS